MVGDSGLLPMYVCCPKCITEIKRSTHRIVFDDWANSIDANSILVSTYIVSICVYVFVLPYDTCTMYDTCEKNWESLGKKLAS